MTAARRPQAWFLALLTVVLVIAFAPSSTAGEVEPGSAGTDTSLPATDSVLTVSGRGEYADLAITVNQTRNLTNQAVSITWTGGRPTRQGPGRFGANYLQIMQCWGDDAGTIPANPGPPPEQCVQGAVGGSYGGLSLPGLFPSGFALSRVISRSTWANHDPNVGVVDPRTTNVWLPFRSVDGTVVEIQSDPTFNPAVIGGNFWLNPFFNIVTTNEIAGAVTDADGNGAELFQLSTGVQSSGLGCGQRVETLTGGEKRVPKCWIVVVPRGTPTEENQGTPFATNADQFGVATSPLAPDAWRHRIAIPIEFNPVDSPCSLADEERRLAGSELALPAVASWQPSLCEAGDLPPYSYAPVSDAAARGQLVGGADGAPGMVLVSRPLAADATDASNPIVYAPVTVSGLTIGFNVERVPKTDAPVNEQRLSGVRVAEMNLTPRLVAKLLTQSYSLQVAIVQPPDYPWLATNARHLAVDPDFLQFNPEFNLLDVGDGRSMGGLVLPAGTSDAAQQVWEWILADPEAKAWLDGQPDPWGMVVNPVYSTDPSLNPSGASFTDTVPNSFPKNDPYCFQAPARGSNGSVVPSPLCGTDWKPYARGLSEAASMARAASDGARIAENAFAVSSNEAWSSELPQFLGRRSMLALTDTPSAAQFGLQMARLSRAGDDGPDRAFVSPDAAGLTAGVASMKAAQAPSVLEPAPAADAPLAYPLTALTYAAITPLSLDATARSDYAAFIDYATGAGQVSGVELGQLPPGYATLPSSLQEQAKSAAATIRTLTPPPTTTTSSSTEPSTTTTAAAGSSSDTGSFVTFPRYDSVTFDPAPSSEEPAFVPGPDAQASVGDGSADGGGSELFIVTPAEETPPPPQPPLPSGAALPTETPTTSVPPGDEPVRSAPTPLTPIVALSTNRLAVPALAVVALLSALGVFEITKRPRRARTGVLDLDLVAASGPDAVATEPAVIDEAAVHAAHASEPEPEGVGR